MTTGERIKCRRKELGISAETLADMLNVSPATIYRYEKGDIEKLPSYALQPIAEALNTTPAFLMGWEEEKKPAATESSELALQFIQLYRQLSKEQQSLVVAQMQGILASLPPRAEPPAAKK